MSSKITTHREELQQIADPARRLDDVIEYAWSEYAKRVPVSASDAMHSALVFSQAMIARQMLRRPEAT